MRRRDEGGGGVGGGNSRGGLPASSGGLAKSLASPCLVSVPYVLLFCFLFSDPT